MYAYAIYNSFSKEQHHTIVIVRKVLHETAQSFHKVVNNDSTKSVVVVITITYFSHMIDNEFGSNRIRL